MFTHKISKINKQLQDGSITESQAKLLIIEAMGLDWFTESDEYDHYEVAVKIFEHAENRKPNMNGGAISSDEVAVSAMQVAISNICTLFKKLIK